MSEFSKIALMTRWDLLRIHALIVCEGYHYIIFIKFNAYEKVFIVCVDCCSFLFL